MRGGMGSQVTHIFNESGIFTPGESRHEAKEMAMSDGHKNSHDIGSNTRVYSYETAERYKTVWHQAANFAKSEGELKDIEKLTAEHIKSYLSSRIDQGVAYSTYQIDCSALLKFGVALNMFANATDTINVYNFAFAIKNISAERGHELERKEIINRAYEAPQKLIESLSTDSHRLVAAIQHEGGARVSEASHLEKSNLLGGNQIRITNGKGGRDRTITVQKSTYEALSRHINGHGNGKLVINQASYRVDLQHAAAASGQQYQGSHGLRWNFAQESAATHQSNGKIYEQSLSAVSHEMGHDRGDITERYLG